MVRNGVENQVDAILADCVGAVSTSRDLCAACTISPGREYEPRPVCSVHNPDL